MSIKVGINGLGRIGRCIFRYIFENNLDIEIKVINSPAPIETLRHLLMYDSVHGRFNQEIKIEDKNHLIVGTQKIIISHERNPENIAWGQNDVQIVLESTGKFNSYEGSSLHLKAGAKKVIISAPVSDIKIATIILGVNEDKISAEDDVISIGSCTTNCLAPIVLVLDQEFGIEAGFISTIHAVTNDQNLIDNSHKDLRRARSAVSSIIPTKTGAAQAIGLVLPHLAGKIDGIAIRVPVQNVSMIDCKFLLKKNVTAKQINDVMKRISSQQIDKKEYKTIHKVLGYNEEEIVSIDFNHNNLSAIFDATGTKVLNNNFVKSIAWYDNEWGFTGRMVEAAQMISKFIK